MKSKKLIASEYGIPSSTLSTILKNEQKVNVAQQAKSKERKKPPKHPQVNECLIKWFKQQRNNYLDL